MKQLVLLSGIPASGKSTFVEENGLAPYTISTDAIRLLNHSPETRINPDGIVKKSIIGIDDKAVFEQVYDLIDKRMLRGEYIVVDAQNVTRKAQKPFLNLARKHGYRVILVDVQSDLTLDEILKRDRQRLSHKQVGEKVIRRCWHNRKRTLETGNLNTSGVNLIKAEDFYKTLYWSSINLDKYDKVLIFGDIHGCNTVLQKALGEYSEKNFYIFTGDLFDRGIENGDVYLTIKEYLNKPNVVFLQGNHENHLLNFVKSSSKKRYPIAPTFYKKSLPDIMSKGVKFKDLELLAKKLQLLFAFVRDGQRYIVSHGGLVPEQLGNLKPFDENDFPTEYPIVQETGTQIVNGVGGYNFDVDEYWTNFVNENDYFDIIQFHGHRNSLNKSAMENEFSYNLESKVEFGGCLRVAEITDEVIVKEYLNDVFDEELLQNNDLIYQDIKNLSNEEVKAILDNSKYIRKTKVNKEITAYNFTQEAFWRSKWSSFTTTARGLFLDNTGQVKARGYNKFFNLNENEETSSENVLERLKTPIRATRKENGFLGILSLQGKSIVFFSKSGVTPYSKMMKTLFKEHMDKNHDKKRNIGKVLKLIKEHDVSLTFEVIDCVNDKHIVQYNESKLVLLDAIYNQFEFKTNDELRNQIAELLNFETPQETVLNSIEEYEEFLKSVQSETNTEGYVFRDVNNYMFKLKNEEYRFVKYLRTLIMYHNKNYLINPTRDVRKEIENSQRYGDREREVLLKLYDADLLLTNDIDMYKIRAFLVENKFI